MGTLTPLYLESGFDRWLHDPESVMQTERFVFVLNYLETVADMEGWDFFFTSHEFLPYYAELKAGLAACGDAQSIEVLEDYEAYLAAHGIPLQADAIDTFLCSESDDDLADCRDWREDFSRLAQERWSKVEAYLRGIGRELVYGNAPPDPAEGSGDGPQSYRAG